MKKIFISLSILTLMLHGGYAPCYQALQNTKTAYSRAISVTNASLRQRLFNDTLEVANQSLQICAVYGDTGGSMNIRAINDYINLSYRGLNGEAVPATNNIFENIIIDVWKKKSEELKQANENKRLKHINKEKQFKKPTDNHMKTVDKRGEVDSDIINIEISGSGESCQVGIDSSGNVYKGNCKYMINSKGVKIYCTPGKKMCKTEKEVFNFIFPSVY